MDESIKMASDTKNQTTDKKNRNVPDKFSKLPDNILDWIFSKETSKNNIEIAEEFKLSDNQSSLLAKITGQITLKEMKLDYLPTALQENLKIDSETAKKMSIEVLIKQFLPIREYLKGIENFITQLGGTLPQILPSPKAQVLERTATTAIPTPTISIVKEPFRLAVQENKEILNQLLTANPIKIADFAEPVRPTIKNWLSDYIKQKGTGYHDELERSDYLYKNANAANLPNEERAKLAKILRAYDEDAEVPVSPENKLILTEELSKKELPKQPTILAPPVQTAPPVQPPPTRSEPVARTGPDTYREPVAEEDLEGPLKPLVKPIPRLDGNVVDLKEFGNNKE